MSPGGEETGLNSVTDHDLMTSIARIAAFFGALVCLCTTAAAVATVDKLYEARTIVTGEREETRIPGITECFKDVLVKASGDPRLLSDPRAGELSEHAVDYVRGYRYRDRMEGIPIHDEQGSRDRPYDLTVDFDPEKVDAALRTLGRKPWGAARPRIALFIAVRVGDAAYVLADDGNFGRDQRDSLAAASWQMGVSIALPSEAALAAAGVSLETLPKLDLAQLDNVARRIGGDLPLSGDLFWERGRGGWLAHWQLRSGDRIYHWEIQDVNFDDAFRSALRGAALILSGNGAPR